MPLVEITINTYEAEYCDADCCDELDDCCDCDPDCCEFDPAKACCCDDCCDDDCDDCEWFWGYYDDVGDLLYLVPCDACCDDDCE